MAYTTAAVHTGMDGLMTITARGLYRGYPHPRLARLGTGALQRSRRGRIRDGFMRRKTMRKINGRFGAVARIAAVMGMMQAAAIAAPAQTFKTLVNFSGTNGAGPAYMVPVQGVDGNLYGTTAGGGTSANCGGGCGTVFRLSPTGTLTTLHSFDVTDGYYPLAGLLLSKDGNLYGTTVFGNTNITGTVFAITSAGTLTTLYNFGAPGGGGSEPYSGLIQAMDGNLYGTTYIGGSSGDGTVFKVSPTGVLTLLHSFDLSDGADPAAPLTGATNGNFYGTTIVGGANGCGGTVFSITPAGFLSTVYAFNCSDGGYSYGGLVQASDGDLYGTTDVGGANDYGTIFKLTTAGKLTTLYSFDSAHGANPLSPLVQGTDGNFYGTTSYGGANNLGTVFKVNSAGALTVLHSFNGTDGELCESGLMQATNGTFYGATHEGGVGGDGTVYSIDVGLGPFVRTLPNFGKALVKIGILGTDLSGATSVTFNGTPATFSVESPTFIKAAVPPGTTSGPVQVVTPSGTLTSNVNFQVIP
jgi:uncharacterized repeat protein (TIGR03803 family)